MLEILIELDVEKHVISRRVLVSDEIKLSKLHDIVQILFGWKGYHMHQYNRTNDDNVDIFFDTEPPFYGREYFLKKDIDIKSFLFNNKIEYIYDMGDYWEHEIKLINTHPNPIGDQNVICIGGLHDTPPEDVGGVGGYLYYLEVMSDKSHPEYDHLKTWSKLTNTSKFNMHKINKKLRKKFG